ncbi:sulfurtransferase-like selenium metabolism protein YedF [Roseburia sp.]|jgi:selenium metabolism protein YedF|uniref:sulfurtransferase-like selenium metabolism protein YedF n=1 Tax=Roseburia sp. TaxID=2049040 RepID=UPI0035230C21
MITVNAMGDTCPIPVVKTKNAIKELKGSGVVETLVDNEIAVQNLTKMANQKGYGVKSEKIAEGQYKVTMEIGEGSVNQSDAMSATDTEKEICTPNAIHGNTVVVISADHMGEGAEELGKVLIKGFIYALTEQDVLPKTMLFYNGGAKLTCEESPTLEDLKSLEAQGVEILTCGTCLNHYGLTDKLQVGSVTNMYVIAEKMTQAGNIVKP